MEPAHLDAAEISRLIAARELSCTELMAATLERIERVNPRINAIVSLRDPDVLLAEAAGRDAQLARGESMGWMHGLPHAIKDLEDTAGIATVCGTPLLRDNVPAEDSLLTRRVRAAGAIVIGKTNVPEYGYGSQTYNPVFGTTLNPYDRTRTAGGSSGGAAAALAAGLLPVADGSDYMGSLRNPGAFCNVFGFRPSLGRVGALPPATAFVAPIGTGGAMGRSPRDVALLMSTIAGPEPRVPLLLQEDPALFAQPLARSFAGTRIGWLGDLGGHLPIEAGILELCEAALGALESLGCRVEPAAPALDPERVWQAAVALRHFDATWAIELLPDVKPEIRWEADGARRLTGQRLYDAQLVRAEVFEALRALLETHEFLALPSAQVFPFDAGTHWPQEVAGRAMDTYHRWMEVVAYPSLAGLPVVNVPAGFGAGGLPMGMQLIGRPRADLPVLQLAHAYDETTRWVRHHPPDLWKRRSAVA